MIERYTTKDMGRIWSDHNKYTVWLKVELAVLEVLCEDGIVPSNDLQVIKDKAAFSVNRILENEEETHHDVIAFLTNLSAIDCGFFAFIFEAFFTASATSPFL